MFRQFRYSISIAVACLALTAAAQEPLRLSRADAIHEALARNPALVAARAQVEEARAAVVTATAIPDPFITADVSGQTHLLNPGSGNAASSPHASRS